LRKHSLLDRPYRWPGSREHETRPCLVGDHHVRAALRRCDARKRRLRRADRNPRGVMHSLERPDQCAGFGPRSDQELACSLLPGRLPPRNRGRAKTGTNTAALLSAKSVPRNWRGPPHAVVNQRRPGPARTASRAVEGAHGAKRRGRRGHCPESKSRQ